MIPVPTNPTELADRARDLYESDLKKKLEPEHIGKYLILDVDFRYYELGTDHLAAAHILHV